MQGGERDVSFSIVCRAAEKKSVWFFFAVCLLFARGAQDLNQSTRTRAFFRPLDRVDERLAVVSCSVWYIEGKASQQTRGSIATARRWR